MLLERPGCTNYPDEKGTERFCGQAPLELSLYLVALITPMKRGLKERCSARCRSRRRSVALITPMKRGLKVLLPGQGRLWSLELH